MLANKQKFINLEKQKIEWDFDDEKLISSDILENIRREVNYWINLEKVEVRLWRFGSPNVHIFIYTDASTSGYGIKIGETRIGGTFEASQVGQPIMVKEALALGIALNHLQMTSNLSDTNEHEGKRIVFYMDNYSLCDCWNKKRSKNLVVNSLINKWSLIEEKLNIQLVLTKVTTHNQSADNLSRLKFTRHELTVNESFIPKIVNFLGVIPKFDGFSNSENRLNTGTDIYFVSSNKEDEYLPRCIGVNWFKLCHSSLDRSGIWWLWVGEI